MFQIASFKIICTDSTEILFSQILLKSFFKNRVCWFELLLGKKHLPKLSFFTDSYCAGVSNKHCLLTFFIFTCTLAKGRFSSGSTLSVHLSVRADARYIIKAVVRGAAGPAMAGPLFLLEMVLAGPHFWPDTFLAGPFSHVSSRPSLMIYFSHLVLPRVAIV